MKVRTRVRISGNVILVVVAEVEAVAGTQEAEVEDVEA
jgi:hypothetical protein